MTTKVIGVLAVVLVLFESIFATNTSCVNALKSGDSTLSATPGVSISSKRRLQS